MATSNMVTITSSLVKSLQSCSLTHRRNGSNSCNGKEKIVHGLDPLANPISEAGTFNMEIYSQAALPYNREPYLNLKTGEIYNKKRKADMKLKEDPQIKAAYNGCYNVNDEVMSNDSDSDMSSTKSSSVEQWSGGNDDEESYCSDGQKGENWRNDITSCEILVTVGCQGCYMYYMVPKQQNNCSKCGCELLQFDSSKNGGH